MNTLEESMLLSQRLADARRAVNLLEEAIPQDEFPVALACARNAHQAVIACEQKLREGAAPEIDDDDDDDDDDDG